MQWPRFFTVEQSFADQRIDEVGQHVRDQLAAVVAGDQLAGGQRVAIAVGSRGIDRIAEITAAVVGFVQACGAQAVVVPAMGSHGGATDDGQREALAALGVTPETVGCPVESVVQPVKFGESSHGIPLYFDQVAANADHVIVVNRIKPHTRLTGSIQSGLCKMLMIGLGKHRGAQAYHPVFKSFDYRLDRVTDEIVPLILSRMPVLAGVAIIENALDSVGRLEVLPAGEILAREPRLLATAQDWMPRLPFDHAELLIVDAIGKEISGTGMDTNIIGRKRYDKHAAAEEWPKVDEIYVRRLTEKTAGNASGIGIAEYTHRRVAEAIDWPKTRVNCITAGHPTGAALPVWFDSDQAVLRAVCEQAPLPAAERRWMHIVNTLDLTRVRCSEAYYREAVLRAELEVIDAPAPLNFDAAADLA